MSKKLLINGKQYEVLSVGELGKMIDRKPISIEQLEKRGIFPEANLRGKPLTQPNGTELSGKRLYTKELALKLAIIFKDINSGANFTAAQKQAIAIAFQEELHKITNKDA